MSLRFATPHFVVCRILLPDGFLAYVYLDFPFLRKQSLIGIFGLVSEPQVLAQEAIVLELVPIKALSSDFESIRFCE